MINKLKQTEKSPMFLTLAILASSLLLFQFIILFFNRGYDFFSWGVNIVLVVGLWLLFANGYSQDDKIPSASLNVIRGFAYAKAGLQCAVALAFLVSGIVLIYAGAAFDYGQLMVMGFVSIIFCIALRVLLGFIYLRLAMFIKNLNANLKNGTATRLSKLWMLEIIAIIVYEGLKIIGTAVAHVMVLSMFDTESVLDGDYIEFLQSSVHTYVMNICKSFNTVPLVFVILTSGITIAIAIITLLIFNKSFEKGQSIKLEK